MEKVFKGDLIKRGLEKLASMMKASNV